MKVTPLALPEVLLIEPRVFRDERGYFTETWHQSRYADVGIPGPFVQDNLSYSTKGVLRGLHYQWPAAQGKLVSVLRGEVFDVAVDVRRGSRTFGRWVGEVLSAESKNQLWIPEGFAHGFLVLSERAEFLYKTTDYYHPEAEHCLRWDDPTLAIEWPSLGAPPAVSAKDAKGRSFGEAPVFE